MNFAQYRQAIQGIYAQYRDAVAEAQLVFDRSMGEAFSLFKGDSDEPVGKSMDSTEALPPRTYR